MDDNKPITKIEARILSQWLKENHGLAVKDPEAVFFRLSASDAIAWLDSHLGLKINAKQMNHAIRRN